MSRMSDLDIEIKNNEYYYSHVSVDIIETLQKRVEELEHKIKLLENKIEFYGAKDD